MYLLLLQCFKDNPGSWVQGIREKKNIPECPPGPEFKETLLAQLEMERAPPAVLYGTEVHLLVRAMFGP